MDSKAIIRNILIPTDLNHVIPPSIPYAISLCNWMNAELYILLTYRLIDSEDPSVQGKRSIREYLQEQAQKKIKLIRESFLEDCMFKCHFLVEIGFLHDRINANIRSHNIDLLVIDEKMEKLLELIPDSSKSLYQSFNCPVMFVPPNKIAV